MRVRKNINQGIISWSKKKFSKPISQELYGREYRELLMRWGPIKFIDSTVYDEYTSPRV